MIPNVDVAFGLSRLPTTVGVSDDISRKSSFTHRWRFSQRMTASLWTDSCLRLFESLCRNPDRVCISSDEVHGTQAVAVSDRLEESGVCLFLAKCDYAVQVRNFDAENIVHASDLAASRRGVCLVDDYRHKVLMIWGEKFQNTRMLSLEGAYSCALGGEEGDLMYLSSKADGKIYATDFPFGHRLREIANVGAPARLRLRSWSELEINIPSSGATCTLDVSSGALIWRDSGLPFANGLAKPRGLALSGHGTILVCDQGGQEILEVDALSLNLKRTWPSPSKYPRSAVWWRNRLVVADGSKGLLWSYEPGEKRWLPISLKDNRGKAVELRDPHHLLVHNRRLIVTDSSLEDVLEVDLRGHVTWRSSGVGVSLRDPHQTVSIGGERWIVDSLNDRIVTIGDGGFTRTVLTFCRGAYPRALAPAPGIGIFVSTAHGLSLYSNGAAWSVSIEIEEQGVVDLMDPPRAIVFERQSNSLLVLDYDRGILYRGGFRVEGGCR